MPVYRRWKADGSTYFFTAITYHRRRWFMRSECRRWLGHSFREARRRLPFKIGAIVLLPDHLHLLMTPADCVDYSAIWRLIKTLFTRRLLTGIESHGSDSAHSLVGRRANERAVWQRRFYEHTIRNEEDWLRHIDYIHLNPVKHGLVQDPFDWPWSSIHRFVRKGWLDPKWPGSSPVVLPEVVE